MQYHHQLRYLILATTYPNSGHGRNLVLCMARNRFKTLPPENPLIYVNTIVSRQERLLYIKHGSHWLKYYQEYLLDAKRRKGIVTQPQSNMS